MTRRLHSLFLSTPRPAALALLAAVAAWPHSTAPFTVTFRFGREVLGPAPALDIVLPSVAVSGITQAGTSDRSRSEAKPRLAEIWVTLATSPVTTRLRELARATSEGHPLVGNCELDVTAAPPTVTRVYTVSGCFAKTIDGGNSGNNGTQRLTLGYSSITVSQ